MRKILLYTALFFLASCATQQKQEETEQITADSSVEVAIDKVINAGPLHLTQAMQLIKIRNMKVQAEALLLKKLYSEQPKLNFRQKANALLLLKKFPLSSVKVCHLFDHFMKSFPEKEEPLAWGLASAFPSSQIRKHIDNFLSEALMKDDLERHYIPAMADALAMNGLKTSYSILREGLYKKHHTAFAGAMMRLDPETAQKDFYSYLTIVPAKELRQLNIQTTDSALCLHILEFLAARKSDPLDPNFHHLFYYAVSMNPAFSDKALEIIEKALPENRKYLAQILAQEESWVQMAYIEKARRKPSVVGKLFLRDFQNLTADLSVAEEVKEILQAS